MQGLYISFFFGGANSISPSPPNLLKREVISAKLPGCGITQTDLLGGQKREKLIADPAGFNEILVDERQDSP